MNNGKCVGSNKCRCPAGWDGDHCEKMPPRNSSSSSSNVHYGKQAAAFARTSRTSAAPPIACKKPCRHGTCRTNGTCQCDAGWQGERCHQREFGCCIVQDVIIHLFCDFRRHQASTQRIPMTNELVADNRRNREPLYAKQQQTKRQLRKRNDRHHTRTKNSVCI